LLSTRSISGCVISFFLATSRVSQLSATLA
jgi:hypothetical protein